jgi:DNA polymerase III epsilon subunit-like protein
MKNVFFDCETTGINPYCSEIIEAYFYVNDDVNYYYKARPLEWSNEAQAIHGISYASASLYPDKSIAINNLINWFSNIGSFRLITYTNKQTELGYINFDVAILCNELDLNGYPFYTLERKYKMKPPLSVHETAKWCAKQGYFTAIRGASGRQSFTQENVYKALFNQEYNSHAAKEDVLALVKIYNELLLLKNENKFGLFGSHTYNS